MYPNWRSLVLVESDFCIGITQSVTLLDEANRILSYYILKYNQQKVCIAKHEKLKLKSQAKIYNVILWQWHIYDMWCKHTNKHWWDVTQFLWSWKTYYWLQNYIIRMISWSQYGLKFVYGFSKLHLIGARKSSRHTHTWSWCYCLMFEFLSMNMSGVKENPYLSCK